MSFVTISELFMQSVETFTGKEAYYEKINGEWKGFTYGDIDKLVGQFAAGLAHLGIQPGDKVAIQSTNCPRWAISDYASSCLGAVSVTGYPTLTSSQIKSISLRETLFTELGVFENFKPNINKNFNQPILYLGNIQPELQFDVINKVKSPSLIAADSMNLWIDLFPNQVWNLISKVDIFMLNDEEAMQLT